MSKKEVAVKEETMMTLSDGPKQEFHAGLIKLPRLSLMQKMSKPVENEKAKVGDLYENLGNTVVCTKDKPFSFIPLLIRPVITTYKKDQGKWMFDSQETMTKQNERISFDEFESEGSTLRKRTEIQCYLLAAEDLEKDEMVLPYIFTFRGASMPTGGKSIYTYSLLLSAAKQPIYSRKFVMTSDRKEKDGNTYQVAIIAQPKDKVETKYYETITSWVSTLSSMSNIEIAPDDEAIEEAKPNYTAADGQF